jgi:guanine deaminase
VDKHATDDRHWLRVAIDLATTSAGGGGGPFGAIVVRDGQVLGRGTNLVTTDLDPTAHAEIVAIRRSCRAVNDFRLSDATLYASCEPCPMCLAAVLWARIPRVVYAADRHDAARAGFDDEVFHEVLTARTNDLLDVDHVPLREAPRPFETWLANPERRPY